MATFGATIIAAGISYVGSRWGGFLFENLELPSWRLARVVFWLAWLPLYPLMATAAWRIYRSGQPNTKILLGLFIFQLCLYALWSWTFFEWRSGLWSMIVAASLWLAVLVLTISFSRSTKPSAGWLMLPYLLWVSYAAVLNVVVVQLNPVIYLGAKPGPDFHPME